MTRVGCTLVIAVLAAAVTAEAQDLEPRAFSNAPVGLNFLVAGYGYSSGDVSLDSSLPIKDAGLTAHLMATLLRSEACLGRLGPSLATACSAHCGEREYTDVREP